MRLDGLKIMITGASGFIGSHLSERLAAANELVLVDDFSVGPRENIAALESAPAVSIHEADITDFDAVRTLMQGVDVVLHLAISCLRTSIQRPFMSHDINAGGTLNVCLAAREAGVRRLLYVSSSEIYGSAETAPMTEEHRCNPTTVYGASKLAGEHYARSCSRTYGLPVTVVRPFNTYGPREPYSGSRAEVIPRFILRLLAGRQPVVYGDGTQTRDFTYVDDTVTGMILAAESDELVGDIVNVGYGREVSIATIAKLLTNLVGATEVETIHEAARPGDVARHVAGIEKAKRILGFAPKVGIETGLARTLRWFEQNDIAQRASVTEEAAAPNW